MKNLFFAACAFCVFNLSNSSMKAESSTQPQKFLSIFGPSLFHWAARSRLTACSKMPARSALCPAEKPGRKSSLKLLWLGTSIPPPYEGIEVMPFNGAGFYSNSGAIESLFQVVKPKTVVEVGCWLGQSTMHIATLLPKGGKLYAVDHWLGSLEHQPGQSFWNPVLPTLYQQFLSNVIHAGLTDTIIPVRMSSLEASEFLKGLRPDLVYIDGSHDFESVYADLKAWYPFVAGHGVLCGDDWGYPDICNAVNKFAEENGLEVKTLCPVLWYLLPRAPNR